MGRLLIAAAAVLCLGAQVNPGAAQTYPSRPITLIVFSSPGGASDVGSRIYADVASRYLGQRVVVENKPGAGGILGAQSLQTAAPDGYTIGITLSGVQETLPSLQKLPFDPIKDFTLITPLFTSEQFFIARADLPVKTLADVMALAKSTPKGLTIGDTAIGSPAHLTAVILAKAGGAPLEVVHYSGAGQLVTDLIAGRVDLAGGSTFNSFRPAYDEKKVRLIAANDERRSQRFPDVPTLSEAGYPQAYVSVWWGLMGPANMPQAIVDRLYTEFEKASRDPELKQKFAGPDLQTLVMPPKEFVPWTTANQQRLAKPIKDFNIKIE